MTSDERIAGALAQVDQLRAEVGMLNRRVTLTVIVTLSTGVLLYSLGVIRQGAPS